MPRQVSLEMTRNIGIMAHIDAGKDVYKRQGQVITREKAVEMDNAGVTVADVAVNEQEVKVISNVMVNINDFFPLDAHAECGINERVRFNVLAEILESCEGDAEKIKEAVAAKKDPKNPQSTPIVFRLKLKIDIFFIV